MASSRASLRRTTAPPLVKPRPSPYTVSMQKELDTQRHPLFFLIPVAVGLFFAGFGLYLIRENRQLAARCTEEVPGIVAGMQEHYGNSGTLYAPVFEYIFDGMEFRQESDMASSPPKFSEGEAVTVMVNPDDPYEYTVQGYTEKTTMARVFIILGLVIAAFFLLLAYHFLKINKDEEEGKDSSGIRVGVVFLLTGLFSAAIPVAAIKLKGGSEDFFTVTSTVNGIQTTEQNPFLVIAMLAFCFIFALAFIILGIVMIRKRSLGFTVGASIEAEADTQGNVTHLSHSGGTGDLVLPRVFIAIGLFLLVIGGSLLAYDRISLKSRIQTEAEVIGTHSRSHSSGGKTSRTYYADIEYMLDGELYRSQITVSAFFSKSRVTVWCKPDNPMICRTKTEFLLFYIVLFGAGSMFFAVGLFIAKAMKQEGA